MPLPASAGRAAPGSTHTAQTAACADPAATCRALLVGHTCPAHRWHGPLLQVVPPHLLIIPVLPSVTRPLAASRATPSADHFNPAHRSHRPGRRPSAPNTGCLYRPGRWLCPLVCPASKPHSQAALPAPFFIFLFVIYSLFFFSLFFLFCPLLPQDGLTPWHGKFVLLGSWDPAVELARAGGNYFRTCREGRRECAGACRGQVLPILAMVGLAAPVPGRQKDAHADACNAHRGQFET